MREYGDVSLGLATAKGYPINTRGPHSVETHTVGGMGDEGIRREGETEDSGAVSGVGADPLEVSADQN